MSGRDGLIEIGTLERWLPKRITNRNAKEVFSKKG